MKAYLLTYSQACTPMQAQYLLNDTQAIETWVTPFPYAAILVSKLGVHDLAAVIRNRIPGVLFMVTELKSETAQGWLPGDLWEYVNDPQGAWSRKLFAGLTIPPAPTYSTTEAGGGVLGGLLRDTTSERRTRSGGS